MVIISSTILILISIICLIQYSRSIICPKYKCMDSSIEGYCGIIKPILNTNGKLEYNEVTTKLCEGSQECGIDILSEFWPNYNYNSSSINNFKCKDKIQYPLVDGEICTNNSDCGSNVCDGRCKGKEINSTCANSKECITGSYCSGKCQIQKEINSTCSISEECVNQAGCFNNICTKFWSLPYGSVINDSSLAEVYCQSGFAYDGTCVNIINQDPIPYQCDTNNSCKYLVKETNKYLSLPYLCTCGFNQNGFKYCQLSSESIAFKKYVELSLNNLEQPCHVSKKGSCNNQISYLDIINKQNYYNSWKGNYQLSEVCQINFWSTGSFIVLKYFYVFLFIILFI